MNTDMVQDCLIFTAIHKKCAPMLILQHNKSGKPLAISVAFPKKSRLMGHFHCKTLDLQSLQWFYGNLSENCLFLKNTENKWLNFISRAALCKTRECGLYSVTAPPPTPKEVRKSTLLYVWIDHSRIWGPSLFIFF